MLSARQLFIAPHALRRMMQGLEWAIHLRPGRNFTNRPLAAFAEADYSAPLNAVVRVSSFFPGVHLWFTDRALRISRAR